MITPTTMTPEMTTLKTRLKTTWESGDYGVFAQYLEKGALEFFDRLNIPTGTRLLDVACGAGQLTLPAARKGIQVTGHLSTGRPTSFIATGRYFRRFFAAIRRRHAPLERRFLGDISKVVISGGPHRALRSGLTHRDFSREFEQIHFPLQGVPRHRGEISRRKVGAVWPADLPDTPNEANGFLVFG